MTDSRQQKRCQFLPVNRDDMTRCGWHELDILFISGDAYVDHPAFGVPLLARAMETRGYRVGILAQPDWKNPDSLQVMGRPRLFAAISSGAMDSMVNHYTAAKKIRRNDAYTPGGQAGKRPNRAVIAYTAAVKSVFKDLPIVIGGIEASLRRLAHYDYWDDKVRRSILFDSKADLLVYGMAEKALAAIADGLAAGTPINELKSIRGTASITSSLPDGTLHLPSFEEVNEDGDNYNTAFKMASLESNPYSARPLAQRHGNRTLLVNPPSLPLQTAEIDQLYALPFSRKPHPDHQGKITAYEQIRDSVTSHRGCFGGCAFCAITHHQGKLIQSRSPQSILDEIDKIADQKDFRGTISDIGGPTANMYGLSCINPKAEKSCRRASCLFPEICQNLKTDNSIAVRLLNDVRRHDKVRHVFISSGIRYDLLPNQQNFFDELIQHHISGLLKVAPESFSDRVTEIMRKPGVNIFTHFLDEFRHRNRQRGLRQSIVPYLISGHPGCTLDDMIDVSLYLKRHQLKVEQVQDFTPTPGSLSTCIYHTGKDPFSGKPVYVPRSTKEKNLQKALLLYHRPESRKAISEAFKLCRRSNELCHLFPATSAKRKQAGRKSQS